MIVSIELTYPRLALVQQDDRTQSHVILWSSRRRRTNGYRHLTQKQWIQYHDAAGSSEMDADQRTFRDVLAELDASARNNVEKGDSFERLVKAFLERDNAQSAAFFACVAVGQTGQETKVEHDDRHRCRGRRKGMVVT